MFGDLKRERSATGESQGRVKRVAFGWSERELRVECLALTYWMEHTQPAKRSPHIIYACLCASLCMTLFFSSSAQAQHVAPTTETTHLDTKYMRAGGVIMGAGLTMVLGGAIYSLEGIGNDRWLEGFQGFVFGGGVGLIGLIILTISGIHSANRKRTMRLQREAQRRKMSFTGDGFSLSF